ncbi:MAG TPA: hypothetical protein VFH54_08590 [Mycobacteriales bacterium]|nr:hypothetical protein [Mycobacteriales bacterium]
MKRVAIACALALLAVACASPNSSPSATGKTAKPSTGKATYTAPPATLPVPGATVTMSTAPPPWAPPAVIDNGALSAAYVAAAGLPYSEEMLQVHYHAHLDIEINGKSVEVPPYLGWVAKGHSAIGLSPLHTHDASGVIHIENSVPADFVLGQVFVEWGVRFTPTCIAGFCSGSGNDLAVFVNGTRYDGDPTRIVLKKHEEIAIEYGPTGKLPTPRSSYHFSNGL